MCVPVVLSLSSFEAVNASGTPKGARGAYESPRSWTRWRWTDSPSASSSTGRTDPVDVGRQRIGSLSGRA